MKVTLINPSFIFFDKVNKTLSNCLGLLYIAAYLRSKNHDITIIDALQAGFNQEEIAGNNVARVGLSNKDIIKKIPIDTDIIGVSVAFSHMASNAHLLIKEIKRAFPDIYIVMGGVYPSAQPELAITSDADFIVIGEGEYAFEELITYIQRNMEGDMPNGVLSKKNPQNTKEIKPNIIIDLDAIPFPARDLVPFEEYITYSQRRSRGWRPASIITSRGCPYDCEFCSIHSVSSKKWRKRSAENVLSEIDYLIKNYNINLIEFEDDMLTMDRKRIEDILNGITDRNKNAQKLYWQASNGIRFDTLDEEMLIKFKKSNVRGISLALENGDKDVLKIMNKYIDFNNVINVMSLTEKYGIPVNIFVLYGYPGETKERFNNALIFYKKIKSIAPSSNFNFFIPQPYPNTKLFKRCVSQGYLSEDIFENLDSYGYFSTAKKYGLKPMILTNKKYYEEKEYYANSYFPPRKILN